MEYRGYREDELVSNRAALLLYGGDDADRRAWALEAAGNFAAEGALVVARNLPELEPALQRNRGVVFAPAVLGLGLDGQALILRCMQEREERPKLVLGLSMTPEAALQQGVLRDDLAYRLRSAQVNLSDPNVSEAIRVRRHRAEEALAAAKALLPPASRPKQSPAHSAHPHAVKKAVKKPSAKAKRVAKPKAKRAAKRKR
jgi:hypothetical protein